MNPVEEDRALAGEDDGRFGADEPRGREAMDPATRRLAMIAGGIGLLLAVLIGGWAFSGRHAGGIPVIEAPDGPGTAEADRCGGQCRRLARRRRRLSTAAAPRHWPRHPRRHVRRRCRPRSMRRAGPTAERLLPRHRLHPRDPCRCRRIRTSGRRRRCRRRCPLTSRKIRRSCARRPRLPGRTPRAAMRPLAAWSPSSWQLWIRTMRRRRSAGGWRTSPRPVWTGPRRRQDIRGGARRARWPSGVSPAPARLRQPGCGCLVLQAGARAGRGLHRRRLLNHGYPACGHRRIVRARAHTGGSRAVAGPGRRSASSCSAATSSRPQQLERLVSAIRSALPEGGLLMVDQEGGRVARLRPPQWLGHPPAAWIGRLHERDPAAGVRAAWLTGALIGADCLQAGFDVVAAPVLDRHVPGAHDVIGDRALGSDPRAIATLGRAVACGLLAAGIHPVAKHVPVMDARCRTATWRCRNSTGSSPTISSRSRSLPGCPG